MPVDWEKCTLKNRLLRNAKYSRNWNKRTPVEIETDIYKDWGSIECCSIFGYHQSWVLKHAGQIAGDWHCHNFTWYSAVNEVPPANRLIANNTCCCSPVSREKLSVKSRSAIASTSALKFNCEERWQWIWYFEYVFFSYAHRFTFRLCGNK